MTKRGNIIDASAKVYRAIEEYWGAYEQSPSQTELSTITGYDQSYISRSILPALVKQGSIEYTPSIPRSIVIVTHNMS